MADNARAKRAYDCCHQRKTKCIGEGTNRCKKCVSADLACTYTAVPKKKGPKGNGAKVLSDLRETERNAQLVVGFPTNLRSDGRTISSTFARTPGLMPPTLVKRRPSRAGTRSVTTLTAAQLERKRANDREVQRAIRQRTKDHIDTLERQVRDLTAQLENNSSTKMIDLVRRNEALEQENSVLRARLSHAVSALGVPESGAAGAPSPSDRVHMLSQPRRMSTGTARSAHSVPEIATPVSQPGHWQSQHTYTHHVSSPHVDTPPAMGEIQAPQHEGVRWSPHPGHPQQQQQQQQQHHQVSMAVQDASVHAVEQPNMSYPSPYVMESNARAMSYPLENASMVTSQPMPMSGYGTPTSHPSPHASEYQRHIGVPMHHQPVQGQGPPQHQQHHTSAPYGSYPVGPQQGYPPQVSHGSEMPMMHAQHGQPQMMNEQGQHIIYQPYQSNMKVEH